MFNYSKKNKILIIVGIIIIIISIIFIIRYNNSRSKDLTFISQINEFANGLERYYDKFNTYPEAVKVDLEEIRGLSDNGFNKSGELIYFNRSFDWSRLGKYISNGNDYLIEFNLDNSWPVWNIESSKGGKCRLKTNIIMECISKQ